MTATLDEKNIGPRNSSSSTKWFAGISTTRAEEHGTDDHEQIQQHFKDAFRAYPAGVSVITADSPEGPVGLTATSVCSVSVAPAALAFSLSAASSTAPAIKAADTVVVHLLDSIGQGLAQRFATSGIDRFADTPWVRLATGEPLLRQAATWFRGKIVDTVEVGGSTVAVMEIGQAGHRKRGAEHTGDSAAKSPLVYCDRSWHGLSTNSEIIPAV